MSKQFIHNLGQSNVDACDCDGCAGARAQRKANGPSVKRAKKGGAK